MYIDDAYLYEVETTGEGAPPGPRLLTHEKFKVKCGLVLSRLVRVRVQRIATAGSGDAYGAIQGTASHYAPSRWYRTGS